MKADLWPLLVLTTVYLLSSSVYARSEKCHVPCPRIVLPQVCGSDGTTYPNECVLKETACDFEQSITIVHDGPCEPKCQEACTREYNPQCGTDGKTYGNPCTFKIALCQSNGRIRLAHHGECREKEPKEKCVVPCPRIALPQVCGSDGNTYPNECVLKETACDFEQKIIIVHDGPCEPKCTSFCTLEYNPQCGTDGRTYGNPCFLKGALCESNGRITLAHHGECAVCSLEKDPGPCRGYFPRYFYNSKSKACEMFIYGGCKGNKNNFKTLWACKARCERRG